MKKTAIGMGGMYDIGGSHQDDVIRAKSRPIGFRMSHCPGVVKHCFICKKDKPTKGHNSITGGRFICIDCKEKYFNGKAP